MDSLNNAGLFLIQTVFDIYIFIIMLRIALQWVGADFTNPVFQFAIKLTNPPLKPLRRFVPIIHGIDIGAVCLLVALQLLKLVISVWLQIDAIPTLSGLLVLAFAEILNQLINIFFYSVLALAILSWVSPLAHGPMIDVLHRLSDPLIRPVKRVLPPIAGFDLSPIPVMIILKLLTVIIVTPLLQIGTALALS
jgi:YggT family protein